VGILRLLFDEEVAVGAALTAVFRLVATIAGFVAAVVVELVDEAELCLPIAAAAAAAPATIIDAELELLVAR
jgi:hypothetical protein